MRCPSCGTLVQDNARVCPACHTELQIRRNGVPKAADSWCVSCGSLVPAGSSVCPVCGMPQSTSFNDDEDVDVSAALSLANDCEPLSLISAVPDAPSSGEDTSVPSDERPRQMRLVLIAAACALVLVGGTVLYITRPWDPEAYVTHSKTDADTSHAGYPGELSHLSAQDRVEDAERKARAQEAAEQMDAYVARMQDIAENMETARRDLDTFYASLQTSFPESATRLARDQEELRALTLDLEAIALDEQDITSRRDELLVVGGYLQKSLDMLTSAWSSAMGEQDRDMTQAMAYAALEGSPGELDFEQNLLLYTNAVETLG